MKMNECNCNAGGRMTDRQKKYLVSLFDGDDADKNFTSLWVMRAFAYRMCMGDHNSKYNSLFDLCNNIIGGCLIYDSRTFEKVAPKFGFNPYEVNAFEFETDIMISRAKSNADN